MRFTGQVKIPDLDFPGLPAEVLVEDKQTELFVEGESIGRWSLVDVRAERLISSAFSLKLAGEEVTFLADQPTEFAYNGVDLMANVWARHKAMRFPLRVIATNRSRKGTKPSRIEDLREAIEGALAGRTPAALSSPPSARAKQHEPGPRKSILEEPAPFEPSPLPGEEEKVEAARAYRPSSPTAKEPAVVADERQVAPVVEGKPAAEVTVPETVVEDLHEPSAPPEAPSAPHQDLVAHTESVFKDTVPWAVSTAPPDLPVEVAAAVTVEDAVAPAEIEPPAPDPVAAPEPEPDPDPVLPEAADAPPVEAEPSRPETAGASVPWIAPPSDTEPVQAATPEPTRQQVDRTADSSEGAQPKYVVDLGAFEDHDEHDGPHQQGRRGRDVRPAPRPSRDDAPAMASASQRGGIMGAVRSAFVRTRSEHEHDYVEAPGGLGIKRQICDECGHISIGVSE